MGTVIEIDTDKKCSQCGQPGAGQGGICLDCVAKNIEQPIDRIGPKTIKAVADQIEGMLFSYTANLNQAYLSEDSLKVSFTADISPGTGSDLIVTVKMNFVESRIKEETSQVVNERQGNLFEKNDERD